MSGSSLVKKQRLSDSKEAACSPLNGYISKFRVVVPEMNHYCFDSLLRHLTRKDPPPKPASFVNDR